MAEATDVVVVGAGPAGSAVAATLARTGVAATVLGKGSVPHRVETVPATMVSLLPDLGLPPRFSISIGRNSMPFCATRPDVSVRN